MEGDMLTFAQVMFVIICSLAAVVGIGLGARILWRIGSRTGPRELPPAPDASRIGQLETAIEAIAIEVERISEAQRYTVTLLSERLPRVGADRFGELPPAPLQPTDSPR